MTHASMRKVALVGGSRKEGPHARTTQTWPGLSFSVPVVVVALVRGGRGAGPRAGQAKDGVGGSDGHVAHVQRVVGLVRLLGELVPRGVGVVQADVGWLGGADPRLCQAQDAGLRGGWHVMHDGGLGHV